MQQESQGKRHSARKRVDGNYSLVCGRGRGGQSLPLPMPHSPTSRTFAPLCLLTPALHCVAPIFSEVNQEDQKPWFNFPTVPKSNILVHFLVPLFCWGIIGSQ